MENVVGCTNLQYYFVTSKIYLQESYFSFWTTFLFSCRSRVFVYDPLQQGIFMELQEEDTRNKHVRKTTILNLNESDLRSDVHYLSSSENKAWKKFRPVRDLNPWPLRYRCSALPTELTSQFKYTRSSNIWPSYILNRLFITSRVYLSALL